MNQKGFSPALIILTVMLLIALVSGGYYLQVQKGDTQVISPQQTSFPTPPIATTTTNNQKDNWKTYINRDLNYSFQYNQHFQNLTEDQPEDINYGQDDSLKPISGVSIGVGSNDNGASVTFWSNPQKLEIKQWWSKNFNHLYKNLSGEEINSVNPRLFGTNQVLDCTTVCEGQGRTYFLAYNNFVVMLRSTWGEYNDEHFLSSFGPIDSGI